VVDAESGYGRAVSVASRSNAHNVAEIAADEAGVSLHTNGELATAPVLRGLGEERSRIVVNGATVSSSCPNYMNDPLSYASAARAATIHVLAGITPVSSGGDSIGGTINVQSTPPVFAEEERKVSSGLAVSSFYRSNGQAYGGALNAWLAGRNLAATYAGTWSKTENYTDGYGHKITSSFAESTDHVLTLAAQGKGNLVEVEAGLHNTPQEGFANAQMDMVRNWAEFLNMHYKRAVGAGALDARLYWQGAWHSMNVGEDKSRFMMAMFMPMNTHGRDLGYSLDLEQKLAAQHTLRLGHELHRFRLDDEWPAVAGNTMMMGPNTFHTIHNGRRTRVGSYAELESRWGEHVGSVIGLRQDTVWTNTDAVSGYSSLYATDAANFNALNHAHTNALVDATASLHWDVNPLLALEAGYARKNRAPNLYERYVWSRTWMAALMIGWAGDGNAYVGNNSLQPESANTYSGSLRLRGRNSHPWQLKATPYLTELADFIDVNTLSTKTYGKATLAMLQYANHPARILGGDLKGNATLWDNLRLGLGTLSGTAAWLHGDLYEPHTHIYQIMPMNARLNLNEQWRTLNAGVGLQAVDRKNSPAQTRLEPLTPGYMLMNLHTSYSGSRLEAAINVDNLLNRGYALPMGGVNVDDFLASGYSSALRPLTGRGRSVSFTVNAHF